MFCLVSCTFDLFFSPNQVKLSIFSVPFMCPVGHTGVGKIKTGDKQAVFSLVQFKMISVTVSLHQSYVLSRQKEDWSVLLGIGCLELITEPEPPLFLELQPADRLPEGASIRTDDAQSRTYRGADMAELSEPFWIVLLYTHWICLLCHL